MTEKMARVESLAGEHRVYVGDVQVTVFIDEFDEHLYSHKNAALKLAEEINAAVAARESYPGMSLREWFSGMALQGFCTQAKWNYEKGPCNDAIVERAIYLSDSLIRELSKGK